MATTRELVERYIASEMDKDRAALARDAQDIADTLTRFAKDVDAGLRRGEVGRIAQDVQQLLIRATKLDAVRETAELYAADKPAEQ